METIKDNLSQAELYYSGPIPAAIRAEFRVGGRHLLLTGQRKAQSSLLSSLFVKTRTSLSLCRRQSKIPIEGNARLNQLCQQLTQYRYHAILWHHP